MKYKGYLIDLDGTMYRGKEAIPEATAFVQRLQQAEIPFLFVTNNTTKSQADVVANLSQNFDIHVSEAEVYTGSVATAAYLKEQNAGNKVFAIGEAGLKEALSTAGFVEEQVNPDYVVVALDREARYHDFELATLAIHRGARFISTNKDSNLPSEQGLIPGAGALTALVIAATKQQPTYIGKPEAIIMNEALKVIGLTKEEVIMVGDNYETDIMAGIQNDIDSLLVFSGFTKREDLNKVSQQPTYCVDSLAEWEFK
ncbi:TIGR01457 family HAD-type hydrolase [Carnobacterium gallinarum]|uniref:TIGR01457 family HAD-type hydrolase n=1 Tax=Carnobacterium gallinarum TaxID=2749 RepID=UPI0005550829|nr:TIGR01457 family HAD-type hydrolase [Carnobacterium gallinarum]